MELQIEKRVLSEFVGLSLEKLCKRRRLFDLGLDLNSPPLFDEYDEVGNIIWCKDSMLSKDFEKHETLEMDGTADIDARPMPNEFQGIGALSMHTKTVHM